MKSLRFFILAIFLISGLLPGLAWAEESTSNAELLKRLEALELEVRTLKRQLEVKKEDEDKKVKESPLLTASAKDGFSIKSPDDNFKLRLTGYAMADGRFFTDNKKDLGTTDTFQLRTVRTTFQGTVHKDYDFYISPEFAGTTVNLPDAYMDVHYWPELKLRAGKFKEPFGLERLQSTPTMEFAELGLPSNLVPNRDAGVQVFGDLFDGSVNYAIGAFNGVEDLGTSITDNNNEKDIAARLFVLPFKNTDHESLKGLGAGIAATYGHREGSTGAVPTYRSPGQATIFTYSTGVTANGPVSRLSPQFYYYTGPLGILGEYVISDEELNRTIFGNLVREKVENDAWQIEATYLLTGEDASYKGVTPRHSFSLEEHHWGAFELVGRYGQLDIDDRVFDLALANSTQSISRADAWAFGLNWYLNRNVKFVLDFEHTDFSGGGYSQTESLKDRDDENVIFSRLQLVF